MLRRSAITAGDPRNRGGLAGLAAVATYRERLEAGSRLPTVYTPSGFGFSTRAWASLWLLNAAAATHAAADLVDVRRCLVCRSRPHKGDH